MKTLTPFLVAAALMIPALSFADDSNVKCEKEVTKAIEKSSMYDVVEHVYSKDGKQYVVIFRTASGDAEEASVAVVHANPSTCAVTSVKYVHGEHQ